MLLHVSIEEQYSHCFGVKLENLSDHSDCQDH